jgi:hypothetical protein
MRLRHLLPVLLVPVLSAACCCGHPPTDPALEALRGEWVLEGEMPTASALGPLSEVVVTLSGTSMGRDDRLEGRTASGEVVRAAVLMVSADPRHVHFIVERSAVEEDEIDFRMFASGPMMGRDRMYLQFAAPGEEPSGEGVLRRR